MGLILVGEKEQAGEVSRSVLAYGCLEKTDIQTQIIQVRGYVDLNC